MSYGLFTMISLIDFPRIEEALTLWEDNYGVSQLQYKFLEALQLGNYTQITGLKVFQICEGLTEIDQYEWFTKDWVSEKWKQHSSLFYSIFNKLGKPFVGFNFGLEQFFPIVPCFKTTIYGSGGVDFQFVSKKKGFSLTQVYGSDAGQQFLNQLQVCLTNEKQRLVSKSFNQSMRFSRLTIPIEEEVQHKMPEGDTWIVPEGQYINKVVLNSGDWIDGVSFFTNKGTQSPHFGGTGGSVKTFDIPTGYRIIGISGASGNYIRKFGLILGKHFHKKRFYRFFKYDIHRKQEVSKRVFIGRSYISNDLCK